MLDKNTISQVQEVFKKLESNIQLEYLTSNHNAQDELIELLTDVASCSDKISLVKSETTSNVPFFSILKENKPLNINFKGIPGGHEFSSLILAILNADSKGKLPDSMIVNRIKNLSGKINLTTYVSLDCTNCPEVVQNLNLFASLNENISHTMVDGNYDEKKVKELNILSVPSVISSKDELISSGKTELITLLEKLEDKFGKNEELSEVDLGEFDVAVIGAGPAGISAAIYTARKGLKTVVIGEILGGQVKDTKGIENLISTPYIEGKDLSLNLKKHMEDYQIHFLEHRRVVNIEQAQIKSIFLNTKEKVFSKSIIVATGAQWKKLNVKGEKEFIGKGVAFCPHCDGPLYKNKDIAVIGGGNSGVEAAIDLANIVKSIKLIEFSSELKADKVLIDKLKSLKNVEIITNAETKEVIGTDKVSGLSYQDRDSKEVKKIDLDGIFVQIGLKPNSEFLKDLVELKPWGEIVIDEKCRTNQDKIYAAGDVTTVPFKQIVISMGEGSKAALTAFEELTFD